MLYLFFGWAFFYFPFFNGINFPIEIARIEIDALRFSIFFMGSKSQDNPMSNPSSPPRHRSAAPPLPPRSPARRSASTTSWGHCPWRPWDQRAMAGWDQWVGGNSHGEVGHDSIWPCKNMVVSGWFNHQTWWFHGDLTIKNGDFMVI